MRSPRQYARSWWRANYVVGRPFHGFIILMGCSAWAMWAAVGLSVGITAHSAIFPWSGIGKSGFEDEDLAIPGNSPLRACDAGHTGPKIHGMATTTTYDTGWVTSVVMLQHQGSFHLFDAAVRVDPAEMTGWMVVIEIAHHIEGEIISTLGLEADALCLFSLQDRAGLVAVDKQINYDEITLGVL